MAALQRAVAGGHDHDVAVLVGQHLGLDVPRAVEVPLDEALAAAEGGHRLAHGRVVQLGDLLDRAGDLQAATAAAERRLDGDRQPELLRRTPRPRRRRTPGPAVPAHLRGAGALRRCAGRTTLSPRSRMAAGRRADPGEPGVDDRLGEVGVLGQEPVPGVHGVGPAAAGDVEELVEDQVRLGGRGAAQGEGLVGRLHVQRVAVGVGVHRDRRDARHPGTRGPPGWRSHHGWRSVPSSFPHPSHVLRGPIPGDSPAILRRGCRPVRGHPSGAVPEVGPADVELGHQPAKGRQRQPDHVRVIAGDPVDEGPAETVDRA